MFLNIVSVFIGGGIGALLRFLVSCFAKNFFFMPILGTFAVNIFGCFLIGYLSAILLNKTDLFSQTVRLFVVVGVLGGLTTFSTFNMEIFEFIKSGKIKEALIYLLLSCTMGLLSVFFGYYLYSKVN